LAVFGLSPVTPHDDPARAVCAAHAIASGICKLHPGFSVRVGVTTGKVFCGIVGHPDRHEYTIMGNAVNLAARLMMSARLNTALICEDTMALVTEICNGAHFAESHGRLQLKGIANPVPTFRPVHCEPLLATLRQNEDGGDSREDVQGGRHPEAEVLKAWLGCLCMKGGGTIVLTGAHGYGKVGLTHAVASAADERQMCVLRTESARRAVGDQALCNMQGRSTPGQGVSTTSILNDSRWYVWRELLSQLFGRLMTKLAARRSRLTPGAWVQHALSRGRGRMEDLSGGEGLIAEILEYGLGGDSLGTLAPALQRLRQAREAATREGGRGPVFSEQLVSALFVRLFTEFARKNSTFVLLQLQTGKVGEAVDYGSWLVANALARHCDTRAAELPALVLFIATHNITDTRNLLVAEVAEVAKRSETLLHLRLLDRHNSLLWAAKVISSMADGMQVAPSAIPPPLVKLLDERAAGHPGMINTMIRACFSSNALNTGGPAVKLHSNGRLEMLTSNLLEIQTPRKMRRSAEQLYDQLKGNHQLVVKTACILPAFTPAMLSDLLVKVSNLPRSPELVHHDLEELRELEIVRHCMPPRCVDSYLPRDRFERPSYEFVSRLLQSEVQALSPANGSDLMRDTFRDRVKKVGRGCGVLIFLPFSSDVAVIQTPLAHAPASTFP
jgi:hypothetical protein